jgi:hypothetical protein
MENPASTEKLGQEQDVAYASSSTGEVEDTKNNTWAYLKHYFTSREGWIGDYVRISSPHKIPKINNIQRIMSTSSHPTSGR